MLELGLSWSAHTAPLIHSLAQSVLPRAVLEGATAGWIFADQVEEPSCALVGLPCGYFFGAGRAPEGRLLAAARAVVWNDLVPRSVAAGNQGFLFSFSGPDWEACLPELLPERRPARIFRRTFTFDAQRFAAVEQSLPPLPEGFSLSLIDGELLSKQPGLAREVLETWSSAYTYLKNGCGMAVLRGGEVVSYSLAPFATRAAMEISVATAEGCRRRGLARYAAAAFVRMCLTAGKLPHWECFWDNEPSIRLAEALGFTCAQDYPLFYWEEHPAENE